MRTKTPPLTTLERQRRFQDRQRVRRELFNDLLCSFYDALCKTGSGWLMDGLEDEVDSPEERMRLLMERLEGTRLVAAVQVRRTAGEKAEIAAARAKRLADAGQAKRLRAGKKKAQWFTDRPWENPLPEEGG